MTSNLTYLTNVTDYPKIIEMTNQISNQYLGMMILIFLYYLVFLMWKEDTDTKLKLMSIFMLFPTVMLYALGWIGTIFLVFAIVFAGINFGLTFFHKQ